MKLLSLELLVLELPRVITTQVLRQLVPTIEDAPAERAGKLLRDDVDGFDMTL